MIEAEPGAAGELCLRGAMVTPGYAAGAGGSTPTSVAADDGGPPFFRTNDLVGIEGGAGKRWIEFRGRSDQLVKVAGQFVDLKAAEVRLDQVLADLRQDEGGGAAEVCVVPAKGGAGPEAARAPAAHAFVAVREPATLAAADAARLLLGTRAAMPRGASMHLVGAPLPRDPVTGKVDRRALLGSLAGASPALPAGPALRSRLRLHPLWLMLVGLVGGLDVPWLCDVLLGQGALGAPSQAWCLQLLLHVASVPYLWLLSMHYQKSLRRVTNYVPFGRLGLLGLLHHAARRVRRKGRNIAARAAAGGLVAGTLAGLLLGRRRRRALPWWVAFWLGIPDQIEGEAGWWLSKGGWLWLADQLCTGAQEAVPNCLALSDWLLVSALRSPGLCRKAWRKLREPPQDYRPPAAICGREPPPPQTGRLRDTGEGKSPSRAAQIAEAYPEPPRSPKPTPSGSTSGAAQIADRDSRAAQIAEAYPEWERIWSACASAPQDQEVPDGSPQPSDSLTFSASPLTAAASASASLAFFSAASSASSMEALEGTKGVPRNGGRK